MFSCSSWILLEFPPSTEVTKDQNDLNVEMYQSVERWKKETDFRKEQIPFDSNVKMK